MSKELEMVYASSADDLIVSLEPNPGLGPAADKRRAVDKAVKAGATIGKIIEGFGVGGGGLRTVARHVRFGCYVINGVLADRDPHLDPDADRKLAKRLETMPPKTIIVRKSPPRQDKLSEPPIDAVIEHNAKVSVKKICEITDYPLADVLEYVNYLIKKGYAKLGVSTTVGDDA